MYVQLMFFPRSTLSCAVSTTQCSGLVLACLLHPKLYEAPPTCGPPTHVLLPHDAGRVPEVKVWQYQSGGSGGSVAGGGAEGGD